MKMMMTATKNILRREGSGWLSLTSSSFGLWFVQTFWFWKPCLVHYKIHVFPQIIARGAVSHPEEDFHKMDEQLPAEGQDGGRQPHHRPRREPQVDPPSWSSPPEKLGKPNSGKMRVHRYNIQNNFFKCPSPHVLDKDKLDVMEIQFSDICFFSYQHDCATNLLSTRLSLKLGSPRRLLIVEEC